MKESSVRKLILAAFKKRGLGFWLLIRILSTAGPLLSTYVFAQGVRALETGKSLEQTLRLFGIFLGIIIIENFLRLASKTRIHIYAESILIQIQERIVAFINPPKASRREIVQTIRNLTQSLRRFITYAINTGIAGLISFVTVPIILFFIDKKIFFLEILLVLIYVAISQKYSKAYEDKYESYNKARETYFTELLQNNAIEDEGCIIEKANVKVQNSVFFGWVTLQNIIAVFKFMVIALIAADYIYGRKQISDLVLIVGYTKESQTFLNSITSTLQRIMEVEAGVERLATVSKKNSELV